MKSPYLADVMPEAIAPHRQWVAVYFTLFVQAYNTRSGAQGRSPKLLRRAAAAVEGEARHRG